MTNLGLLSCFLVVIFDDSFSKTVNVSSWVCDCIKISSKYVIAFTLSINRLKFLLINAEKNCWSYENSIEYSVEFLLLTSKNELC